MFTADNRNRPQTFPPLESSVCRDDSTSRSLPLPFPSRSSPRQTISLPSPPFSPITIDNTTATVHRATTRTFLLTPLPLSIRGLPLLAESSVTSCFRPRGKKIQPRHSTKETRCFLSSFPIFFPSLPSCVCFFLISRTVIIVPSRYTVNDDVEIRFYAPLYYPLDARNR